MPVLRSARRRRAASVAALTAATLLAPALLVAAPAAPAAAAPLKTHGAAKVVSVDGPDRLTIENRKRQRIAVKLFGIDAPQPGECGAEQATQALRDLTARKLPELRYVLVRDRSKRLQRDGEGRYVGRVIFRWDDSEEGYTGYELGARLADLGWARTGIAATLDTPTPANMDLVAESEHEGDRPVDAAGRPRGLWAVCGGRLHLPASEPVAASVAVPWSTDANGVTKSIGPLALPTTLAPGETLTLERAAALAGPLELIRYETLCIAELPALQVQLLAWVSDRPGATCRHADVQAIYNRGPGVPSLDRGVRRGDGTQVIRRAFPLVDDWALDSDTDGVPLAGDDLHTWAWQTHAQFDERGRVDRFVTYAIAPIFE